MTSISQSVAGPLRATNSSISPTSGKRKYREGGDLDRAGLPNEKVVLSALTAIKVETASKPHKFSLQIGKSLRLPCIAEKFESAGLKPKDPSYEEPVADFDDDSSDDGFGEFDDPSYKSCIVREAKPLDLQAMSTAGLSRTSSSTTLPFPPLSSGRSGSSSDSVSGRKPALRLSLETVVKARLPKETTVFDEFRIISGSFPSNLAPLLPLAFASGRVIPSSAGKNGSCRIFDETGKCIAIFKPREGELGFSSSAAKETKYLRSKEGLDPGEGALSEYICFRINEMLHLIDIPTTCYVKVRSNEHSIKKEGSLHAFIPGARNYADLTTEEKALLSKEQVEALAIFDLFIFNADRNEENLLALAKPGQGIELIGIDHGCILPRSAQSGGVFCWSELQQAKSPISPRATSIIESLSSSPLRALRDELQAEGFEDVSLENFSERLLTQEVSMHMLKTGSRLGLSLAEIANFFQDCPPAINPLHKIITSSQKKGKSEKEVIVEIQTNIEYLISSYLSVKGELKDDSAIEPKDLDKISLDKAITMLDLYTY